MLENIRLSFFSKTILIGFIAACNSGGTGTPEKDSNRTTRVVVEVEECQGEACKAEETEIVLSAKDQCQKMPDKTWKDGLCVTKISQSVGNANVNGGGSGGGNGNVNVNGSGDGGGQIVEPVNIRAVSQNLEQTLEYGNSLEVVEFSSTIAGEQLTFEISEVKNCPEFFQLNGNSISGDLSYDDSLVTDISLPTLCTISVIGKNGDRKSSPKTIKVNIVSGYFSECTASTRSGEVNKNIELIQKRLDETDCVKSSKLLENAESLDFRCTQTGFGQAAYNENLFSDISLLKSANSLKSLCIKSSLARSLEGLGKLTKLETFTLSGDSTESGPRIRDFSPLSALTGLRTLNLWSIRGLKLGFISSLTELERLDLSFNMLKDINDLSRLQNLKSLMLAGNRILDLTPIEGLALIEEFSILGSPLADLSTPRPESFCPASALSEVIRTFCTGAN